MSKTSAVLDRRKSKANPSDGISDSHTVVISNKITIVNIWTMKCSHFLQLGTEKIFFFEVLKQIEIHYVISKKDVYFDLCATCDDIKIHVVYIVL